MKIEILGANTQAKRPRLRVCAYARVSTASDAQEDSLDNQRITYERLITPIRAFPATVSIGLHFRTCFRMQESIALI